MAMCNGKEIACSHKSTENHHPALLSPSAQLSVLASFSTLGFGFQARKLPSQPQQAIHFNKKLYNKPNLRYLHSTRRQRQLAISDLQVAKNLLVIKNLLMHL